MRKLLALVLISGILLFSNCDKLFNSNDISGTTWEVVISWDSNYRDPIEDKIHFYYDGKMSWDGIWSQDKNNVRWNFYTVTFKGTIDNDYMEGVWSNSGGDKGTWFAKKLY